MSRLLRYFKALQKLSAEDVSYISGFMKTVDIAPGEDWILHGTGAGIACIQTGLIKRFSKESKAASAFYEEGDILVLGFKEHYMKYVAIEQTCIHYIEDDDMIHLCERYPVLNHVGTKLYYVREEDKRIAERQFFNVQSPIERVQRFIWHYPRLASRLPDSELAEYLFISATIVGTARKKRGLRII